MGKYKVGDTVYVRSVIFGVEPYIVVECLPKQTVYIDSDNAYPDTYIEAIDSYLYRVKDVNGNLHTFAEFYLSDNLWCC